tara:strand:+ start:3790 stop:4476 length:687 start_codon:yes stop_codon:yes gene_type:complete
MYRFKEKSLRVTLYFFFVIIFSCSTPSDIIKIKTNYKKDLDFVVNNKSFKGIAVPKLSKSYLIEIETPFKINYVKIESCHREVVLRNVYHKKRIIKNRKKFQFNYKPIGIEKECILFISALNEAGKGRFAQILFQAKQYNIKAINFCNGQETTAKGVSLCQSKKGLVQMIHFDEDLEVRSTCPIMSYKGKKNFKYEPESGDCVFLFMGKDRLHKLVSYGYNEVLYEDE